MPKPKKKSGAGKPTKSSSRVGTTSKRGRVVLHEEELSRATGGAGNEPGTLKESR
jgi:hypothetical protein